MLKIKSNTNKFTIIFLRRLERKRMLKRSHSTSVQFSIPSSFLLLFFFFSFLVSTLSLFQPSFSFSFSTTPFFFFSVSAFFLFQRLFFYFLVLFSAPLLFQFSACFSPFSNASLFLFFRRVALFSAQNTFSAQNVFQFSPNVLLL